MTATAALSVAVISVAPIGGAPSVGTPITIVGRGFVTGCTVTIGGSPATSVVFVSSTQLTCTTPLLGASRCDVTVTNPDGQLGTGPGFYAFEAAPTVSAATPSTGPVVGTTILTNLAGTGFLTGCTVTIGGAPATNVVLVSSTKLTCTVPAGSAGAQNIVVTNPDTQSSGSSGNGAFTYAAPTEWAGLSPLVDWDMANAIVASGTALDHVPDQSGNARVLTASATAPAVVTASASFNGLNTLSFTGGAGATFTGLGIADNGPVSVIAVAKNTGPNASGFNSFLLELNNQQLALYAAGAAPHVWHTWASSNFAEVVSDNAVTASAAMLLTLSGGTERFYVNSTVEEGNQASAGGTFSGAGIVGSLHGGPDARFVLNGEVARIIVFGSLLDATQRITALAAIGAKYGIAVTYAAPTFTSLSVGTGPTTGGTATTITGTGFLPSPAVTFGGVTATSIVRVSSTSITCVTPAGSGAVDVVITNTDAQSVTGSGAFAYAAPLTVSTASPNTGPLAGGTIITNLAGTGFVNGCTVKIDGVAATATFVSSVKLTVTTPAGSSGAKNIVVTNPDTTTSGSTGNGAFTYAAPTEWGGLTPLVDWDMANAVVSSGSVDTVPDTSGNGNTATGVTSHKPTPVAASANFNSANVIAVTSTQRLSFGNVGVAVNGPVTVLVVGKVTGGLNTPFSNRALWVNAGVLEMYCAATSGVWTGGCSTNFATKASAVNGSSVSAVAMLTSGSTSSGTQRLYVNSTTEAGNGATNGFDLTSGGTIGEASFGFNGQIARVIIFGSILDATQRANVLNALGTKYGITIS